MGQREDDLDNFITRWLKTQRRLRRAAEGKPDADPNEIADEMYDSDSQENE